MTLSRRTFLGFLAAPAIIRVAEIMPIKPVRAGPITGEPQVGDVIYLVGGKVYKLCQSDRGKTLVVATVEPVTVETPFMDGAIIKADVGWEQLWCTGGEPTHPLALT